MCRESYTLFKQGDSRELERNVMSDGNDDGVLLPFNILTHLLFHVEENVTDALQLTFRRYSLPTCLDNLRLWHEQAMENETSCYREEKERHEAVEMLYHSVQRLLEALYLTFSPQDIEYSKNVDGEWSIQHEVPHVKNKPIILTRAEFKKPVSVIIDFRQTFGWEYLEMELWDWMMAAMTNDSDTNLFFQNRSCLMDFYMHIHFVVHAVFHLSLEQPY